MWYCAPVIVLTSCDVTCDYSHSIIVNSQPGHSQLLLLWFQFIAYCIVDFVAHISFTFYILHFGICCLLVTLVVWCRWLIVVDILVALWCCCCCYCIVILFYCCVEAWLVCALTHYAIVLLFIPDFVDNLMWRQIWPPFHAPMMTYVNSQLLFNSWPWPLVVVIDCELPTLYCIVVIIVGILLYPHNWVIYC